MNRDIFKKHKLNEIIQSFTYGKMPNKSKVSNNGFPIYSGYRITGCYPQYMYEREKLIVIARGVGGIGKVKISPKKSYITNLSIIFNEDESLVNYLYLFYYLSDRSLRELDTGSCQSQITVNQLQEKIVFLPNIEYQEIVVSFLSDLDVKIELNNKINTELEAMAKLIYDYWFVQFDFPDANGKPYKSSGGKMVYNEALKRKIPEGWMDKELSEIANITMGQSPTGSSYNDNEEGTIFFQGSTDFGCRFPSVRQYTTEPNRLAKVGDVLLSVRAPVGTLNVADNDCCIGRGLAALNSKDNADSFLFNVMLYFKQIFDRRNAVGTTFGSITKDDLFSLKLVYPSQVILKAYDEKVADFNLKILNNHQQNKQLIELRDWLLPMLMNGQVTVNK